MTATLNNPTAAIARFIARTNVQDIPAEAFDPAKKVIADTFAAILAGSVSEVRTRSPATSPPGISASVARRYSVPPDASRPRRRR